MRMELDYTKVATVLVGRGVHTHEGRTYVKRVLRADPLTAFLAVARVLTQEGISTRTLPTDAGILTPELLSVAGECAKEIADKLWLEGTPLSAFFTAQHMAEQITLFWKKDFGVPIPAASKLAATSEEERNARTTVAVQAVARLLRMYAVNNVITLTEETFEGMCSTLTRIALAAYDEPNKFNHDNIHRPKEDPRGAL